MTDRHILLFDLDAVLITSEGYYESLRRAVDLLAGALGFGPVRLSQEDIDAFESLDITAEWDSCAICSALLLTRAWERNPGATLPEHPPLPRAPNHGLTPPDFREFALSLADGRRPLTDPLARARHLLIDDEVPRPPGQAALLHHLLTQARNPARSLTFQLIQELNLGSDLFSDIYGRQGTLKTEGMLATLDRPTLAPAERQRLQVWLGEQGHHAAIVTNRPSRSPGRMFNTPEAEIGIRVAGLTRLPFISAGVLGWFAERHQAPSEAYLKPSPVHMLAGMRLAVGHDAETAVSAAQLLATEGFDGRDWSDLDGAKVSVFEDAAKGLRSAQGAADLLAARGVQVTLDLYGIAASGAKQETLRRSGAEIHRTLSTALERALESPRSVDPCAGGFA
jgi:hypothetical protein